MNMHFGPSGAVVRWEDEQKQIIAKMLKDGSTAREIAAQFSVTRNSIIGIVGRDKALREIGFSRKSYATRKSGASKAEQIVGALKANPDADYDGIAAELQTVPVYVRQVARRYHLLRAAPRSPSRQRKRAAFSEPIPDHAPPPRVVALVALKTNECLYPIGDPKEAGFGFCGRPAGEGTRYCAFHHRLCHARRDVEEAA
ncbi:GcrA family cell cycle regulator [Nitratireductor sp. GCM10026969]|uniref:GcrA family cell cycle regulator n=1 Tax=Nitratireductor sp. GCM10026969 TaxID=3252645 RepID=UPI0036243980